MKSSDNIQAWFDRAPLEVPEATERLLAEVAAMRETGETVYPAQENILNALGHVAPGNVRAVILGQDPYHGPGQAMGLSFSVPASVKLPPSLRNIYKELAADLGCAMPASGDLTSWAEQGVLLLNTVLTVREHAAASHSKLGWQTLTTWMMRACMELPQPVVFLAWGRPSISMIEAARAAVGNPASKFVLASTHPSPLSANRAAGELPAFMGSRPFSQANALLEKNGGEAIDWASVLGG